MLSDMVDPELLNHFSVLIYPFFHGLTPGNRTARLAALEERWGPWWERLTDAETAEVLDGSAFFLPYVQGLLFPETTQLQGEDPGTGCERWVACVRDLAAPGLAAYAAPLPPSSVLRLTCRCGLHAALADFRLARNRRSRRPPDADLPVRLDWVDVLLFPSGVGFLLFKVRLAGDRPRLSELMALNAGLRQVRPPTLAWDLPVLRFPGVAGEPRFRDLVNFLLEGLTKPGSPEGLDAHPGRLAISAFSGAGGYTETAAGRAYGERCHLFSYACAPLGEAERAALAAGAFADGIDRLLYEFAAGMGPGDSVHNPVWVPAAEQAERVGRENRLAMWRCWRGMALKESCMFLATEDLGFNRNALAHNTEYDYLPLYLYTLYQKHRLLTFADGLMREVAQRKGHLSGARVLLRRFVSFRNRFWFSEVTRRPMGGDLYRLLQQAQELQRLYDMVTTSIKEAKEYYEERWDRQVRQALTVLGWVAGPLAAVWGAARLQLGESYPLWVVASLASLLLVGGSAALLLWWRRATERREVWGATKFQPRLFQDAKEAEEVAPCKRRNAA
jgi:hypothetical protein